MKAKSMSSSDADDDAELLGRDGEDEVGVASGRMRLTVPSPGPRPSQPPREKDSIAVSTWKVSPDALSRKRSMRARTCGRNS